MYQPQVWRVTLPLRSSVSVVSLADTVQRRRRAVIVVAELHDYDIARFEHRYYPIPITLRHETCGSGAADGAIHDVDFRGVEIRGQRVAPAPLSEAVDSIAAAVADRRIANQKQVGQRGVGGIGQIEPAQEVFAL